MTSAYPTYFDIDTNGMNQAGELEDRNGRYEAEYGVPYTPDRREVYWPQWGIIWERDANGMAWTQLDEGESAEVLFGSRVEGILTLDRGGVREEIFMEEGFLTIGDLMIIQNNWNPEFFTVYEISPDHESPSTLLVRIQGTDVRAVVVYALAIQAHGAATDAGREICRMLGYKDDIEIG